MHVHLGSISYDELRFGVLEVAASDNNSAPMLLVDPEGAGRKAGLSGGRDQDVVILLDDNVDGKAILCDVAAMSEGSITQNSDEGVKLNPFPFSLMAKDGAPGRKVAEISFKEYCRGLSGFARR